MAQEYISQVSEEIERNVTGELSKEFSRTESRILGALSKPDKFLLNPQFRTFSVAILGTSRSNGSESRNPTGDCSLCDPSPEAVFSASHSGDLNDSEHEETHQSSNPSYYTPKRAVQFPYSENIPLLVTKIAVCNSKTMPEKVSAVE